MICDWCQKEFVPTGQRRDRRKFCGWDCTRANARQANAARLLKSSADRFWQKVKRGADNECWEWQNYRNRAGYGQVGFRAKLQLSHRVAYLLANGNVPDGMDVMHTCDNPPCCNPAHLRVGTHQMNLRDSWQKGRRTLKRRIGEAVHNAKLTEDLVREIRASSVSPVALAQSLGISYDTLYRAKTGRTWRHVQ